MSVPLGVALEDPATAAGFVAAVALASASLGALLALLASGRGAFGPLIAVAPVHPSAVVVAGTVVPAAVVSAPSSVCAGAFLLPALSKTPGGLGGTVSLAFGALSAVAAGGAIAECALQVVRGRRLALLWAAGVMIAWLACGLAGGRLLLGPGATVARTVAGKASVGESLLLSTVVLGCAGLLWAGSAVRRPVRRASPRRRPRIRVREGRTAVGLAVGAVVARRRDLRSALVAAASFGVAGVAVARALGLVEPLPLQLGVATVILAAAVIPVSVPGVLLEGRAIWWSAPVRRSVSRCATGTGVCAAAVPTVPALALAAASGQQGGLASIPLIVILTASIGVAVGAAIPLRRARAGDQIVSFTAFVGAAALAGLGIGHAGTRLVAAGVPDALVGGAFAASLLWLATLSVSARLGRG